MEVIVWTAFGAIVGWITSILADAKNSRTIAGDVVIGIIGALVGGCIMNAFGQTSYTGVNINSLVVATLGSVIILFTYKTMTDQV